MVQTCTYTHVRDVMTICMLSGVSLIDEGDVVADNGASSSQFYDNWEQQNWEQQNWESEVKNAREVSHLCQTLSNRVSGIARRGDFCLTIGGDHR